MTGGALLLLVIRILWERGNKVSGLAEDERNQLRDLHTWHNQRDSDGVLTWMVPRAWVDLLHGLIADTKVLVDLIRRLIEQNDGITADLRKQLQDRLEKTDEQQDKMLRIAVRSQRAIEALAGLEPPGAEDPEDV